MNRKQEGEFSYTVVGRIIESANPKGRVSESAKRKLAEALEDIADDISAYAVKCALGRGKKTVKAQDVKNAVEAWRQVCGKNEHRHRRWNDRKHSL